MKKIVVKICSGTTCFFMGSSYLNDLYDLIPRKFGSLVSVEACVCLNQCSKGEKHSKAPYVKIDDEIVQEATVDKVMEILTQRIKLDEK